MVAVKRIAPAPAPKEELPIVPWKVLIQVDGEWRFWTRISAQTEAQVRMILAPFKPPPFKVVLEPKETSEDEQE